MKVKYSKEIIAGLIIVVGVIALYTTFSPVECTDLGCFEAHMVKCKPATYINNAEEEASWEYNIIGTNDEKCDIEVKLLNAKEGGVDLIAYEGQSMWCSHPIGAVGYPEKDLSACRGELKEGLQAIVIEKLYKYLVTNLGEIRSETLTY